ncbi:unnamed protein product [Tilletia controversa]|nr:unnamed protein product [Tilletia controversa]
MVTLSTRIEHFAGDVSGLQRDAYQHRSDSLRCAEEFRTKKARETFERESGARASPLFEFAYWRSVERAPIDPMHNAELGMVKRLYHRTVIDDASISKSQLQVRQGALSSAVVPPSEQAPDRQLGDPGGGSATAAHWSTLGRRLLVLLLYVAWKGEFDGGGTVVFVPTKRAKAAKKSKTRGAASGQQPPPAPNNTQLAAPPEETRERAGPSTVPFSNGNGRACTGQPQTDQHAIATRCSLRVAVGAPKTLQARAVLRNARAISTAEVQTLERVIFEYGRLHAELFGDSWIVYNHHIATHIPQFIRRFGPAFHFSAYHFERMNGQLGKTTNNGHRNGELEGTYTSAFTSNGRFGLLIAAEHDELSDLFKIDAVLSHTIHLEGDHKHVTVYLLGSRAAHLAVPAFDGILQEMGPQEIARLFWVQKERWGDVELLPAYRISSDAAMIEFGELMGVSAGEDQRRTL